MKKIVLICLGIGMVGAIASADFADTITLSGSSVTEDTHVKVHAPDDNFGSIDILNSGYYSSAYPKVRILVKFDLSSIPPGATITSATLSFYRNNDIVQRGVVGSANSENSVYRGLKAWTEGGATWNTNGLTSWNGSSGPSEDGVDFVSTATDTQTFVLGTDEWMDFTVTSDIQLFMDGTINNGWMVRTQERDQSQDGRWTTDSSEASVNTPKLVINYVIAGVANITLSGSSVTEDTYVKIHSPDSNYGSSDILNGGHYSGAYPKFRTLVKFDLSSLPSDITIHSAILSIYRNSDIVQSGVAGSANSENSVYRGLKTWTEGGATWNTKDGSTSWNGSSGPSEDGVDFASTATDTQTFVLGTDEWMDFTVTSDIQLFMDGTTNYGWMVRTQERDQVQDGRWTADSSEGSAAYTPALSINYYIPPKGTLIIIL